MNEPAGSAALTVTVNGRHHRLPVGSTVASLVAGFGLRARGTAVARNGEVVPAGMWAETALADGDRIELLRAAPGG